MSFGSAKPRAPAPAEMPAEVNDVPERHESLVSRAMHGMEHFLHLDHHEASPVEVQTVQTTRQVVQAPVEEAPHESLISRAVHGVEHFLHLDHDNSPKEADPMPASSSMMSASMATGAMTGADGEESSLAAEVLQLSNILAQEGSANQGAPYCFPVEDLGGSGGGRFELSRDDTLHLIGLLNSPEIDFAKRELSTLLRRLDRPAVEGLTRQLFAALRRRSGEIAILEDKASRAAHKTTAQGSKKVKKKHNDLPATERMMQEHPDDTAAAAGPASLMTDIRNDGIFSGVAHWIKDHTSSHPTQAEDTGASVPQVRGELCVRVVAAFNLLKAPVGGVLTSGDVADPFVVIRVGSDEYKTAVIQNSVHPIWDSEVYTFIIDTSRPERRALSLEVFHSGGHFHSNKRLGFLQVDILSLLHQGPIRKREKLQGGGDGELELELLFKPEVHRQTTGQEPRRRAGRGPAVGARSLELPVASPRGSRPEEAVIATSGRGTKAPGGVKGNREEMPQVFRRLTAPVTSPSFDELIRARNLASGNSPATPLTVGGIMSTESGPQASAYLEALLEAHEMETGVPATSSRRQLLTEETEIGVKKTPRVPEEKAKQIFDRLYKSGKEHRVRRRVYHELGLLVEQAKEAQTCTHLPCVPLAAYPGGQPLEGSVSERLYREGLDRMRRREEMQRNVQPPPFRPQILAGPPESARRENPAFVETPREPFAGGAEEEGGLGPDGLPLQNVEGDEVQALPPDQNFGDEVAQLDRFTQPSHIRLFNEHFLRQERQRNREEEEAEWRKFNYKPDISTSQASGPQIVRASSLAGFQMDDGDDYPTMQDENGPSLAALAADALTTPRDSDQPDEVSTDFAAVAGECGEALLLIFPDASWPAASNFEEEVANGLAMMGATCLENVDVRLPAGVTEGGVTAELTGPHEALAELRELNLFELAVLGYRVGEVRWTALPNYLEAGAERHLTEDTQTGELEPSSEDQPMGEEPQMVVEEEAVNAAAEMLTQEAPTLVDWSKTAEGFQAFRPEGSSMTTAMASSTLGGGAPPPSTYGGGPGGSLGIEAGAGDYGGGTTYLGAPLGGGLGGGAQGVYGGTTYLGALGGGSQGASLTGIGAGGEGSLAGGSLGGLPAAGTSASAAGGGPGSLAASVTTELSRGPANPFSPRDRQVSTSSAGVGSGDGASSAPQPRAFLSPGSLFGPPIVNSQSARKGMETMEGGQSERMPTAGAVQRPWEGIEAAGGVGLIDDRNLPYVKPPTLIPNPKVGPPAHLDPFMSREASSTGFGSNSLTPQAPIRSYSGRLPTHSRQGSRGGGSVVMPLTTEDILAQDRLATERLQAQLPSSGYLPGSGAQTARMYSGERAAAALAAAGSGSQTARMYSAERAAAAAAASASTNSLFSPRTDVGLPRASGLSRMPTGPIGAAIGAGPSGYSGASLFSSTAGLGMAPPQVATPTLSNRPSTGGNSMTAGLLAGTPSTPRLPGAGPGTPRHPATGPPVMSGFQPRPQTLSSAAGVSWLSGASSLSQLRTSTLAY
mmetsp:Transcript_128161/g.221124  ORF Transcript_128161/g.221124 Transcript_128161/m.221124 type:complete len:1527 (+) Transcript_128161:154-4734(+)